MQIYLLLKIQYLHTIELHIFLHKILIVVTLEIQFLCRPFNSGNNPNPSSEFLNLNLSLNVYGKYGGSFAFDNINPNGWPGFGSLGQTLKHA